MKHKKEVIILFSILFIIISFLIIYKPSIIGYVTTSAFVLNSPPNLITNIPDQTWLINIVNNDVFDLDNYFSDPNLDPIDYTVVGNSSITIGINSSTNMVSFSQPASWTGTEHVTFSATDDDGETAESNNVSLTVTSALPAAPPSGGGPGGAAVAPAPTPPTPPIPVKIKGKIFYIDFTIEDERTLTSSNKDIIMITCDGMIWHRTDLEEIAEDSITLIIHSTPITVKLKTGETKEIDINEDRIGDVSITLIGIEDGRAKLKFKELAGVAVIAEEKPLFDVDMEVLPGYQRVFAGSPVAAEIKIYNLGVIAGIIGVRVDYFIKDPEDRIISSEYEIKTVETQIEYIKEIAVPEDLGLGEYVLEVQVLHNNRIVISSASFEVIKKPIKKILFLILAVTVLIIALTAFIIRRKRTEYYKERRSLINVIKDFKKKLIKR
jgi:hypothetical protein